MDYKNYLNLDKILNAQTPVSQEPSELMFIVAHQSSELWFKVLIQELNCLIDTPEVKWEHIKSSSANHAVYNPTVQLQRVVKIFEHLNTLWDVIATMSVEEYERFRSKLGTASGKQSEQYIKVETLLKKLPSKWNPIYEHFLSDIENAFKKWQFSHMKAVERIIGDKKGTGGTSGVSYLKHAIDKPLYTDYKWKGW